MNILVISNEVSLANEMINCCINKNYNIFNYRDTPNVSYITKEKNIDIFILDLDSLKENKIEYFKQIKKLSSNPIIVLSSINNTDEIVLYFSLGADDFIVKPFSVKELLMRIQVIYNKTK